MKYVRRKIFISYHHADQAEVEAFVRTFDTNGDLFITRAIGLGMQDDIINSTNTDYVMQRIRQLFLGDSTVTIVLMGKCTWARRYVDWEIQSSLRGGQTTPNGLFGIKLSSFPAEGLYPNRLNLNLRRAEETSCYARVYDYPDSLVGCWEMIEDAFQARTARVHLIKNPRDRKSNSSQC